MAPCSGPVVCSVSRPSSSRNSHSTPMAMKDLVLGARPSSSLRMNWPVSRFLTAEKGSGNPRHRSGGVRAPSVGWGYSVS